MDEPKIKITSRSSNVALDWIEKLFYNLEFDSSGLIEYQDFADKRCSAQDIGGCKVKGEKLIEALENLKLSASTEILDDVKKAIYWCQNNLKNSTVIFRKDHFKVISD